MLCTKAKKTYQWIRTPVSELLKLSKQDQQIKSLGIEELRFYLVLLLSINQVKPLLKDLFDSSTLPSMQLKECEDMRVRKGIGSSESTR